MTEARSRYDALHRRSLEDVDGFWLEAAERLDWGAPPTQAFAQPSPPTFEWFPDGRTNLSVSALDRHVRGGAGTGPRSSPSTSEAAVEP